MLAVTKVMDEFGSLQDLSLIQTKIGYLNGRPVDPYPRHEHACNVVAYD